MARAGGQRTPRMIRGSVVVQRRRCGKATCRCADGESLHEATVLSYSQAGRNRTVMLAPDAGRGGHRRGGPLPPGAGAAGAQANAGLAELLARAAARRGR